MPVHVMQLLDVASRITLFLVGQAGPLSFTFRDRLDNKFRTQIGPELHCSCSPQRNDHCIHTAYVLLRVFRLPSDDPLLWQAAYVDS
jgi:E3 ubiquitin-protein ligase ZSWIM2